MGGWVLAAALLGPLGLVLAVAAYMAHVITSPPRARTATAPAVAVAPVTFSTPDGLMLHGWYLAADAPRDAIIVAHGFKMPRDALLDLARALRARGHAVLLFDFRAHGLSDGGRSTIGYNERLDVIGALRFLQGRPELAGRGIGVLGLSMGAVAAILAAAEAPALGAVVADSGYMTLQAIAAGGLRRLYGLPAFPFAPLIVRFGEALVGARITAIRPIDAIARIAPRPVLIVHGEADRLIPVANAHALDAAAGEPKELWLLPGLDHARAYRDAVADYVARIDCFFATALATRPGRDRP